MYTKETKEVYGEEHYFQTKEDPDPLKIPVYVLIYLQKIKDVKVLKKGDI